MKRLLSATAGSALAVVLLAGSSFGAGEQAGATGSNLLRRISADQYRQIIHDVFGGTIEVGGRFEPDTRTAGLFAVGASAVSISTTGLEQYEITARTVSAQVVDERHRDTLVPCTPANVKAADDACAAKFLGNVGRLLLRRPITDEELKRWVAVSNTQATQKKDFYEGLARGLANIMVSPQFIFRRAKVEDAGGGKYELDAYSKASQLSFWLWNSTPDLELLTAAEKGELNTKKGLAKQVDRMLASPRLEAGVRAFFTDMLVFSSFEGLSKDASIYPKYTSKTAVDAQEQTLRTIVDHLLTQKGDYRDLFTTRKTFLTPLLGALYGIPVPKITPNGAPDLWVPYEYAEGDPRAGILSHASFVALHSHPGRSSPTLRGKALREVLLCQKVPDPPNDVNFTIVQDVNNPQFRTARDRVNAHLTNPVCAGCHKITDPAGLALEVFDSAGGFRKSERGQVIDTSGEFSGVKFANTLELAKVIRDTPTVPKCLTTRVFSYAMGRAPTRDEDRWLDTVTKDFAASGYKLPELFKRLATSPELYKSEPPQVDTQAAQLN